MSRRLETALDESLACLNKGESIESCLQRFPELRDQLEPLLQVAGGLARMAQRTAPSDEALARVRQRFMAQVYQRRAAQVAPAKRKPFWMPLAQRGFLSAAIVIVLVIFLLGGTGIVSANSLPGDPLYGVKLASENVRIWLTPDSESRILLRDYYASLRVAEVKQVMEKGRETQVSFSGVVERVDGDVLVVQGIPVYLGAAAGSEQPAPGTKVQVVAQTKSDGTVAANSVDVQPSDQGVARATETAMAVPPTTELNTATTVPPSATATAQEEKRSERRSTSTATPSPTEAATVPPTPTALPTSTATALPTKTALPTSTPLPTLTPMPTATLTRVAPQDISVRFEGRIDEITGNYWRVDGKRINLRSSTKIDETIATGEAGGWAAVQATKKPDGTLYGKKITVLRGSEKTPVILEFSGVIESLAPDHWIVAGRQVAITAETTIEGQAKVGLLAHIRAEVRSDGTLVAKAIKVEPESQQTVQIEGIVEKLEERYWIVAGLEIWLDEGTKIEGTPAVGTLAKIEAVVRADGKHWALSVKIQAEEPPTEAPTVTVTVSSPEATPTVETTQSAPTSAAPVETATVAMSETPGPETTATASAIGA